jgi:hypothetical protein
MSFNDIEKQRTKNIVGGFCESRIPIHAKNQVQLEYEILGNGVKIFECRPYFNNPSQWTKMPIARMKFDSKSSTWTLYWARTTGHWGKYPDYKPKKKLESLVKQIDNDPLHVFLG